MGFFFFEIEFIIMTLLSFQCMELLSKSSDDIQKAVPVGGTCVGNSSAVQKLRRLMETVSSVL
jgi:hypothetical protein